VSITVLLCILVEDVKNGDLTAVNNGEMGSLPGDVTTSGDSKVRSFYGYYNTKVNCYMSELSCVLRNVNFVSKSASDVVYPQN